MKKGGMETQAAEVQLDEIYQLKQRVRELQGKEKVRQCLIQEEKDLMMSYFAQLKYSLKTGKDQLLLLICNKNSQDPSQIIETNHQNGKNEDVEMAEESQINKHLHPVFQELQDNLTQTFFDLHNKLSQALPNMRQNRETNAHSKVQEHPFPYNNLMELQQKKEELTQNSKNLEEERDKLKDQVANLKTDLKKYQDKCESLIKKIQKLKICFQKDQDLSFETQTRQSTVKDLEKKLRDQDNDHSASLSKHHREEQAKMKDQENLLNQIQKTKQLAKIKDEQVRLLELLQSQEKPIPNSSANRGNK